MSAGHEEIRREHGYHPLRVRRIVDETPDTRSFVLDVPQDLRDLFGYRPGQFCTFRVRVDGAEVLRSYSMSSAPETDEHLTVTVKRVPGGVVSNWLHDTVAENDILEATRPAGVFCVRDGECPVVALCGGSGVTPVLSIVKSVLATTRRPVRVLFANRDRDSVIFAGVLRALTERYPDRLDVRYHYDVQAGFPTAADITGFAMATPDADFFVCGPGPFMALAENALLALGVGEDSILIERFLDAGRQPADPTPASGEPPEAVTIILHGKKTTVAYRPGDTVLETARRGGMQPPFSCEAGDCATCMAIIREGSATMRENNALTDDEVADGWVLTCQALPRGPGDVTVEYEAF
jgi:ferredoxin-NADP reductase